MKKSCSVHLRSEYKKKEPICTYSDHCAMRLIFKVQHKIPPSTTTRNSSWKITESGLERFRNLTHEGIVIKKDSDVQNSYSSLEYEIKKIMGKCFKLSKQKIYKNTRRGKDYEVYYSQLRQCLKEGKFKEILQKGI